MKNHIILGCILSLGIICAAGLLRSAVISYQRGNRTVSVKGLSEREVKANKVTWPMKYKELGNNPAEMYNILEQKNQLIINFLKAGGIKESEISITPPTVSDRQADSYYNEQRSNNYRYIASSVITVTSTDVDRVRQLMSRQGELMKQGVAILGYEWSEGIKYDFTDLNKLKPEMMDEATENALITAQRLIKTNKTLNIRSATQGYFSIEDRDKETPYIKRVRVVNTVEYIIE